MERYIELLKKCNVETYEIESTISKSVELFFIKKKLDMRRMKNVDSTFLSVFEDSEKDGKKYRGRGNVLVTSSMTDEEIVEKIKSAKYAASFAMNPFYEFPAPIVKSVVAKSDLNDYELSEVADKFVEAVYSQDNDPEAFINSFEVFSREKTVRILNSKGNDVSFVKRTVWGEMVTQCKEPQDVETYDNFEYDSLALDDVKDFVATNLKITKDRAKAEKMPTAGKYDVVLSGKFIPEVLSFYGARANAGYIYPGYSDWKVEDKVQGENIKGDKLNLKLAPQDPFSDEGIEMTERDFIKDGVLKTIHGGIRFSYYLGVEPIGNYKKIISKEGTVSMEKLLDRPCLHVVNFSDFQMDELDGHFAGEIRLAYLYDGKGNVELVTGGSINGSIFETQEDLLFSKELQKQANYEGPKACLFKNVAVAGE